MQVAAGIEATKRSGALRESWTIEIVIVLVCLGIYWVDMVTGDGLALSGLYAVPILASLHLARPRFTISMAALSTVLAVAGLIAGVLNLQEKGLEAQAAWDVRYLVFNDAITIVVLWLIVGLGLVRLRTQRQLAQNRETTATTLRSIADAVITTDAEGRVAFLNPVAEALVGVRQEFAIGQPLEAVFRVSEEQPLRPPIEELEELELAPQFSRARLSSLSGHTIGIEESRAPIRDGRDRVLGSVVVFRDITERRRREEDMARLAYRDELTGLPNRTSLYDRLSLELAHARRNRESLALLFLDLDDFKRVNDTLGHAAGDELLRTVALRLRASLRECDTIARLGGDEFTVILPGISGPPDAERIGDKLLEALDTPVVLEGQQLEARASIGIAIFPHDGDDPDQLMRRADEAMYRAKQRGGDRRALFDSGFYKRPGS